MKPLVAALLLAFVFSTSVRAADALVLPKNLYPKQFVVKANRNVSNTQFDANDGCTAQQGGPLFHAVCGDALNRVTGWVEYGTFTGKNDTLRSIALFTVVSAYTAESDAKASYDDFASMIAGPNWNGTWKSMTVSILPGTGEVSAWRLSDKLNSVWGLAVVYHSGSTQIESLAVLSEKRDAKKALKFLTLETNAAIAMGPNP